MSFLRCHSLLWFILLHQLHFAFSAIQQVPHNDPSIQYLPKVCDLDCTRVCAREWWLSCLSNGGASHRTKGNGTSANFSFRGTSVTWYTRTAPDGGKATVYINSADPTPIDTNSPVTIEANPVYTKSGLDGTRTQMISIVYDVVAFTESYERFVDIHHFEYDDSSGGNQASASAAATTSRASTTQSGVSSSTAVSAGSTSADTRNTTLSQSQTQSGNATQDISLNALYPTLLSLGDTVIPTVSSDMANSANIDSQTRSGLQLSPASIAGVVFGASGFLLLTAIFIWCVRLRRKGSVPKAEPIGTSGMYEVSDIGHGHRFSTSRHSQVARFQNENQPGNMDSSAGGSRAELLVRGSNSRVYASSSRGSLSLKTRSNDGDEEEFDHNGSGDISRISAEQSTWARTIQRQRTQNSQTSARPSSVNLTESGTGVSFVIDDMSPITEREIEEVRRLRAARSRAGYTTTSRAETPPPRYVQ
ncbi:hypothetical protein FRC16_009811 [Serendipita sp. 398]|nr:hypothetical protein FRC16_009811 [Serendipita sp. 398]